MFTACIARKMLTIGVVIAFFERKVLAWVQSFKVSLVYTTQGGENGHSKNHPFEEYRSSWDWLGCITTSQKSIYRYRCSVTLAKHT